MKQHEWRWAIRDMPLDKAAKTVAWALASRMNKRGSCWPSKSRLVEDTGYTIRTVDAAVRRLEIAGLLEVRRRPPAPNLYMARLPRNHCGVTPQLTTPHPATIAGEDIEEEREEFAHAIQVNQAMLKLARGWLAVHQ